MDEMTNQDWYNQYFGSHDNRDRFPSFETIDELEKAISTIATENEWIDDLENVNSIAVAIWEYLD